MSAPAVCMILLTTAVIASLEFMTESEWIPAKEKKNHLCSAFCFWPILLFEPLSARRLEAKHILILLVWMGGFCASAALDKSWRGVIICNLTWVALAFLFRGIAALRSRRRSSK